jgi:hypothetical protein
MNAQNFTKAVEIISKHHSTEIKINGPQNGHVGLLGYAEYNIYISKCCPAVTKELLLDGYSLNMTHDGLQVDKF